VVDILQKIKCRLSQLLQLWLNEVNEHIDGWESWDCVTLMEHDSLLDIGISILAGSVVVYELPVKVVEVELYLCSPRQLSLTRRILILVSFGIELSSDGVLVDCYEICYHVPEKMHLFCRFTWERWAKISESLFNVFCLILDLLRNLREVMLDVCEHDLGKLLR
jgi:hypothetical protein